jgi:CRISPR-associated protein Csb2
MFAIGIRYLCGWAMATHPADRERPEWPPHPDRVFMALAAAHFETGGGPDGYAALKLLSSSRTSPALSASGYSPRQTVTTFVPVNDDSSPISKKGAAMTPSGSMPIGRDRQPRSFPVAIPERDTVFLIWPDLDVDEAGRTSLANLCRKVGALGHSASLVQMWVEDSPPEPTLVPTNRTNAESHLRVAWSGRLDELQDRYQAGLRPNPTGWQGYSKPPCEPVSAGARTTAFSHELIVLRRTAGGRPLGLESTLLLTEALRCVVMRACPDPPPEWISGHQGPDGPPSQRPHLAFLPLAHVGRQHADGRLMGMALAVPRDVPDDEQRRCLSPFLFDEQTGALRETRLTLGQRGVLDLKLADDEQRPRTLQPEVWTSSQPMEPSDTWATVTPIVLDRYPKERGPARRADEIDQIIAASFNSLWEDRTNPVPIVKIVATSSPLFAGVPHARDFPPLRSGPNGGARFHLHALIIFAEPIVGPLMVGAGRYRGYGLCRPWREGV